MEISIKTNLLERRFHENSSQGVQGPNLQRDIYTHGSAASAARQVSLAGGAGRLSVEKRRSGRLRSRYRDASLEEEKNGRI